MYDKTYTTKTKRRRFCRTFPFVHSCITEARTNNSISSDHKKKKATNQTSLTSVVCHQPAETVTQTQTLIDDRLGHDGVGDNPRQQKKATSVTQQKKARVKMSSTNVTAVTSAAARTASLSRSARLTFDDDDAGTSQTDDAKTRRGGANATRDATVRERE